MHSPPTTQVGSTQHSPACRLHSSLEMQPDRPPELEDVVVGLLVVVVVGFEDVVVGLLVVVVVGFEVVLVLGLELVVLGAAPPSFRKVSSPPLAQLAMPKMLPATTTTARSPISAKELRLIDMEKE
jgi:hypothetical protein